jgi:hypothetical protein
MSEQGSDDQMTPEQRAELEQRTDLEQAMVVEEERRTAAAPDDGEG